MRAQVAVRHLKGRAAISGLLAAWLVALFISAAHAEGIHRLKGAEIRQQFTGKVLTDGTHWKQTYAAGGRFTEMTLLKVGQIAIPDSNATVSDHGAFEPRSRRVFVAHTARSRLEVIDHDTLRHVVSLDGFPGAAGVVADDGIALVTNRGSAQLAVVDATTLRTRLVLSKPRPLNGSVSNRSRKTKGLTSCPESPGLISRVMGP